MHDEWLRNIIGQGVLGQEVNRDEVDALMQMGWRLTWKEKTGLNKEEEKDADREADRTEKRKPKQADSKMNPSEGKKAERTPKARCFAKGFTDKRKVDTYVGAPSIWAILLCLVFALSFGLIWYGGDVKGAFLSAEDRNRQRTGVVIPTWISKAPDLNPYPDISDADTKRSKQQQGQFGLDRFAWLRRDCMGCRALGISLMERCSGYRRVEDSRE
uniref:Uncharacterized protein n=1 Tax=Chromera velia CCMP2878 TaxID=1169474 RepID=A0A0G4GUE6_9ALVE|eukprot:Cvel_23425.t1-p1 / transcript=Cvel_23425.t1 / gene=Cvel_23425 / organism=Chromera_velia_CCMP2878 / gene_product=hypothetical protein / transcript_product=hypothetical protein / location=Cvel_scaffold2413:7152-7793(+) / protein_length=214 / sequence_SO=supercontig / SO=protein_coding / is_pseudo=false